MRIQIQMQMQVQMLNKLWIVIYYSFTCSGSKTLMTVLSSSWSLLSTCWVRAGIGVRLLLAGWRQGSKGFIPVVLGTCKVSRPRFGWI